MQETEHLRESNSGYNEKDISRELTDDDGEKTNPIKANDTHAVEFNTPAKAL